MNTIPANNLPPWPAPAKINLMLRITGRRSDGYHLLQTVFQLLDFGDSLQFQVRSDGEIRRLVGNTGVPSETDLIVRAARLLQAETGCRIGVDISIEKRIPLGGGLGGGSSNAATTLVALNHLWDLGLQEDELAALGLRLGADVPIFVRGHSAWAEGVGEQLQALELPCPWYLLLMPDCHVSTAEVFASADLTRNSATIKIADFLAGVRDNVCEPVVRARYPQIDAVMRWLDGYSAARLTGTGACVFASFETQALAQAAQMQLPAGTQGIVCRGLNRSPLLDRLTAKA